MGDNGKLHLVGMTSLRYQTFSKSKTCVCCGIIGTVMLLELPTRSTNPHFNLYTEREGSLVQMTKDHKTPKSKGGQDNIHNMQTMHSKCNELKGNSLKLRQLRKSRDGTQVIYMIHFSDNTLVERFATTRAGLEEITRQVLIKSYGRKSTFSIRADLVQQVIYINSKKHSFTLPIKVIERI